MNHPAQLDIDWRGERDTGMERASNHAEALDDGWSDRAYATLKRFCIYRGSMPFTSEDFRIFCRDIGFVIPVPKALGNVFTRARKAGLIRRRLENGTSFQRHGSPCPLWEVAC